jgi:ABC-type Fe3+/spermidine/putrescine transport system ATPase subunit
MARRRALDEVSLTVARGEFLTLLGPSGSGKTTMLMAIAGFVAPTAGRILLDGQPIQHLPPERRNFGMVFQGYALFPHLSVARNIAFPLEVRGQPRAEIERRVRDASSWCSSTGWSIVFRASSPAASNSVLRWRARWSSNRICCCSTSR